MPELRQLAGVESPATRQVVLNEEFAGAQLDPVVWNAPARPDVIGVDNGRLTFRADPTDTAPGLHTGLLPRDGVPFDEVSLVVSVPEYRQAGPGGVALIVIEAGGRNHRLMFGPSEGGPEAAALVCARTACAEYEDHVPHLIERQINQGLLPGAVDRPGRQGRALRARRALRRPGGPLRGGPRSQGVTALPEGVRQARLTLAEMTAPRPPSGTGVWMRSIWWS